MKQVLPDHLLSMKNELQQLAEEVDQATMSLCEIEESHRTCTELLEKEVFNLFRIKKDLVYSFQHPEIDGGEILLLHIDRLHISIDGELSVAVLVMEGSLGKRRYIPVELFLDLELEVI